LAKPRRLEGRRKLSWNRFLNDEIVVPERDRPSFSSALARNDPTLRAKSDPAPLVNRYGFPAGKRLFAPGQIRRPGPGDWSGSRVIRDLILETEPLTPFRADDGKANRTPLAWMISLAPSFAVGQIVFFVWVTLSKHKWVILAKRRGSFYSLAYCGYLPIPARMVVSAEQETLRPTVAGCRAHRAVELTPAAIKLRIRLVLYITGWNLSSKQPENIPYF
jgi:hypothetical protein